MPQFYVDDELAALVERLAKPKPFENLPFNAALRRVLHSHFGNAGSARSDDKLEQLFSESMAAPRVGAKKAPSPSVEEWVATVPELRSKKGLTSWKAVCDVLRIDTAGDSARRKLKNWVKSNRPAWPQVPAID